ncbi:Serine/arginine repetitive matrix protein 2 [Branchiostoma belcheri]|nr:Serine/arginine repetitive matrix protein 2 [Branchiostoma belcheri]
MYNGIGLNTPRGSGTNGYVTRNWAHIRGRKEKVNYKTEEEMKKLDAAMSKKPNQEILDHERKRKVELKCMEMQELMEEQGYSEEEIERKVATFRRMLMEKEGVGSTSGGGKEEEVERGPGRPR